MRAGARTHCGAPARDPLKHAAAVVADHLSAPVSLRYDRYSQERYGRHHDSKCNRRRRPRPRPRPIRAAP